MKKVVILGAGNLATHLGRALIQSGNQVLQIFSRNPDSGKPLAKEWKSEWIGEWNLINPQADFYLIALPDSILPEISEYISFHQGFWVHCSGASPLGFLEKVSNQIGVIYPLQTFSKELALDFSKVPLFLESGREEDLPFLMDLAQGISEFIYPVSSEKRLRIHLAAVFANNFSNHLFRISEEILLDSGLSMEVLFPIMAETLRKAILLGPQKAQTGPALRRDQGTMDLHLEILKSYPALSSIYQLISTDILENP